MKLINKDTLIAEIEKLKERYSKYPTRNTYEDGLKYGRMIGYEDALHEINTLEVKEFNIDIGSPEGDIGVKILWDGNNIVSIKTQKGE